MRTIRTWTAIEPENPRRPVIDPHKHNYYKKIMKLVAQGKLPRERLSEVDVYHDDWCRIYRGGYCNFAFSRLPIPERNGIYPPLKGGGEW